jgi:biofilm PGA synthesis N-glycosyltransferase PgaC
MKVVFWASAAFLAYTYFGYPLWLWVRSAWMRRPVGRRDVLPPVSVIMAVHNEEAALPRKLRNVAAFDYPPDRLQIVVVSDGSTDATNAILQRNCTERIQVVICRQNRGKAAALNEAFAIATGEVLVFTDARQRFEADTIRKLVANFADARVGCVSGELLLGDNDAFPHGTGLGLYWQLEKQIRRLEGTTGSMVGVTGAVYAARRNLVDRLPVGTILDDVLVPMRIARQGYRIVWESEARAWDESPGDRKYEFRRKVRTLVGNYQLMKLAPWLLTPENPLLFEFVSHKLLRLAGPLLLLTMLVSSMALNTGTYRWAMVLQLAFYSLAAVAIAMPKFSLLRRVADAALTFLVLNTAAAVAFAYFIMGKKRVWTR